MRHVALVTDRYDEVIEFYGQRLGFPVVDEWDRPNARGVLFDLSGVRLEILDNHRERRPLTLSDPADRFHVVVEVEDIEKARAGIEIGRASDAGDLLGRGSFSSPRSRQRSGHIPPMDRERKSHKLKSKCLKMSLLRSNPRELIQKITNAVTEVTK